MATRSGSSWEVGTCPSVGAAGSAPKPHDGSIRSRPLRRRHPTDTGESACGGLDRIAHRRDVDGAGTAARQRLSKHCGLDVREECGCLSGKIAERNARLLAGIAPGDGDHPVGEITRTDLNTSRNTLDLPIGGTRRPERRGHLVELDREFRCRAARRVKRSAAAVVSGSSRTDEHHDLVRSERRGHPQTVVVAVGT